MEKEPILVVDDEKNIRLTMAHALESLDLKMPGLDGLKVLCRIKDTWPAIRVIIITAHGTVESAVEAMKLGAVDFIQKPFSPGEIRQLGSRVLQRESLDEENAVDYPALIELAKRHISDRSFAAARATARRAIAADPAQPEAYNLLGALLEINQERLEALKFYRAALDINPTFKPAAANLERATSWEKFGGIDLGPDKRDGGYRDESGGHEHADE